MAEVAVARHGVSIALACRTFGGSETCYRYASKLVGENEEIADLLVGLTNARVIPPFLTGGLPEEGPSSIAYSQAAEKLHR